ncbi:hypothetical protein PBI_INGRID_39 [Arthrobacter phage Ingrid]|nr:hypothetical protein PBI_INGRID_39 [Arthrobacter phage Ingrid]QFG11021.1 hypothetical protein PBI_LORETTA_39 [Arthrobacter phage Loretta]
MENQKKTNKFKKFITNHPDAVFIGAATGIVATMYTYAVVSANKSAKAAIKAHNEYADKVNSLIARADSEGKATFLLADWSYLLVPKDVPTEWIKID